MRKNESFFVFLIDLENETTCVDNIFEANIVLNVFGIDIEYSTSMYLVLPFILGRESTD